PEAPLDAQMTVRDLDIERRRDLHDAIVLNVQRERAAHPAVGTDRVGAGLSRFVPMPLLPQLVFAAEHQRTGWANTDTVAAINASGIGQRHIGFRRDPRIEASTGHCDGEGVLGVGAARLNALVAEDAFPIVANIQVVIDLHWLSDGLRFRAVGYVMM